MKNFRENMARMSWRVVILFIIFQLVQVSAECNDDQFECKNGQCLDKNEYKCDGKDDCAEAEDELNCSCDDRSVFRCNNGTCISTLFECNGIPNCPDNEDEDPRKCATPPTSPPLTTSTEETTPIYTEEPVTQQYPTTY